MESEATRRAQFRSLIADAIYTTKAYSLPGVCERYGLRAGNTDEAFSSKKRYVMERLESLPDEQVLAIAKKVVRDFPHDGLLAAVEAATAVRRISTITRGGLLEVLNGFSLSGKRDLMQMLRAHWPSIDQVQSEDRLFATLAGDIERHMVTNEDWSNEILLERVGWATCSQAKVFAFLEDVVHPIRRDRADQAQIVPRLNEVLRRDGFCLDQAGSISGYRTYKVTETTGGGAVPGDDLTSLALAAFGEFEVREVWAKALDRRDRDPDGAITIARSLLESVCKQIIEGAGGNYGAKDDLPKLYHAAAQLLNLAPSQHTERTFKSILGSCQSIVGDLAAIRGKLGDAHGQGKRPVKPRARHAQLAVNLAGAMATFLVATWAARHPPNR